MKCVNVPLFLCVRDATGDVCENYKTDETYSYSPLPTLSLYNRLVGLI